MSQDEFLSGLSGRIDRIEKMLAFIVKGGVAHLLFTATLCCLLVGTITYLYAFIHFSGKDSESKLVLEQSINSDNTNSAVARMHNSRHANSNVENIKGISIKNSGNK